MKPRLSAHATEWMKLPATQRGAWINLLRVYRKVTRSLDDALAREHDLTLAEWDALVHIGYADEGIRMSDLAGLVLLTPSGITRMIERFEARALVERRRGTEDARETFVRLTRRGYDLLGKAAPTHNEELQAHLFDALPARDWDELHALLKRIADAKDECERHPAA